MQVRALHRQWHRPVHAAGITKARSNRSRLSPVLPVLPQPCSMPALTCLGSKAGFKRVPDLAVIADTLLRVALDSLGLILASSFGAVCLRRVELLAARRSARRSA
jgi:hypothetical protein